MFPVGKVIVRRPALLEQVIETPETEPSGRYRLRMLCFGKAFATDIITDDMEGARLATDEDRRAAQAWADTFKEDAESIEKRGIQTYTKPADSPPQLELFPSPAGEGEPGSPGRARRARAGARAPSGGGARRRRRGGAQLASWLMALEAMAFGRGFR